MNLFIIEVKVRSLPEYQFDADVSLYDTFRNVFLENVLCSSSIFFSCKWMNDGVAVVV